MLNKDILKQLHQNKKKKKRPRFVNILQSVTVGYCQFHLNNNLEKANLFI